MQLPVKVHYATLAMLALAGRYASRELLPARIIAREHGIPNQFLGQILQQLRAAGLITSVRGANGGFQLERPPSAISVGEIVDAVCPSNSAGAASEESSPFCGVVSEVWDELRAQQRTTLQNRTLGDLLLRLQESSGSMFYI